MVAVEQEVADPFEPEALQVLGAVGLPVVVDHVPGQGQVPVLDRGGVGLDLDQLLVLDAAEVAVFDGDVVGVSADPEPVPDLADTVDAAVESDCSASTGGAVVDVDDLVVRRRPAIGAQSCSYRQPGGGDVNSLTTTAAPGAGCMTTAGAAADLGRMF